MTSKQIIQFLFGLMIGSYAYIFDDFVNPALFLSTTALIFSLTINIELLYIVRMNIMKGILIVFSLLIFKILNIESFYNGITIVSVINIIVSHQIIYTIKNNDLLKEISIKMFSLYLVVLLLTISIPSSFISSDRLVICAIFSSLFLPFLIYFVIIDFNYQSYFGLIKEVKYDSISNRHFYQK